MYGIPCVRTHMYYETCAVISIITQSAQSRFMVEKFLNFWQNLSAFVRGWQGMRSGHWCHMTLLDHVTPVGRWQLVCPGQCPCSVHVSLSGFWWPPWLSSWTHGLPCPICWPESFRLHLWPVLSRCSPTAILGCRPVVCSLYLVHRLLLVSAMYILSQLSHFSWYMYTSYDRDLLVIVYCVGNLLLYWQARQTSSLFLLFYWWFQHVQCIHKEFWQSHYRLGKASVHEDELNFNCHWAVAAQQNNHDQSGARSWMLWDRGPITGAICVVYKLMLFKLRGLSQS